MIQTRQLAYRYPNGPALEFADVSAQQGGVLLLRGDSGAGKSTWMALVAGLRRASGGEMVVAGQALNALSQSACDAWRAKAVGFLPQKLHLARALSVHDNLALAQWAAGVARDNAAIGRTLAQLGVADLARRKPGSLSGGQAQRVALARAVLLAPQVLLADEPTASLDDDAAAQALDLLLATAQQHQATLVIATHDARVASRLKGASGLQTLALAQVAA
ncbi:MAG: ATP-binding cassette domain-containing protein [Burkholderiales bacterium]